MDLWSNPPPPLPSLPTFTSESGPTASCCLRTFFKFAPPVPVDYVTVSSLNLKLGQWIIRFYFRNMPVGESMVQPGMQYGVVRNTWVQLMFHGRIMVWWGASRVGRHVCQYETGSAEVEWPADNC